MHPVEYEGRTYDKAICGRCKRMDLLRSVSLAGQRWSFCVVCSCSLFHHQRAVILEEFEAVCLLLDAIMQPPDPTHQRILREMRDRALGLADGFDYAWWERKLQGVPSL